MNQSDSLITKTSAKNFTKSPSIISKTRRWWWQRRHIRLSAQVELLRAQCALYERYPQHLDFADLQKMAKQKRRLKKLLFELGLIELQLRFIKGTPPQAHLIS